LNSSGSPMKIAVQTRPSTMSICIDSGSAERALALTVGSPEVPPCRARLPRRSMSDDRSVVGGTGRRAQRSVKDPRPAAAAGEELGKPRLVLGCPGRAAEGHHEPGADL